MTEQIRQDYEAALTIASLANDARTFEQACVLVHRIADQADERDIDLDDINRRFDNGE